MLVTMGPSRRDFIAGTAAGAVLAAAPRAARAQAQPARLRVAGFAIDVGAGPYYATDMGFFAKHGIEAEITTMIDGAAIVTAVLAGALDIGNADTVSIAQARARGLPVAMIAPSGAYRSSSPTAALMVPKNSTMAGPRDMVGKTLGSPSLHGFGQAILLTWGRKMGLRRDDFKAIEVPFGEMPLALGTGRVDVVLAEEPMMSVLAAQARVLAHPYDAVAPLFVEGGFFCTPDFARKNPEVIKRFADAIAETNAWANAHHDESFKILTKYSKAPLPKTMTRVYFPERLRASEVQPMIDVAAGVGFIPKAVPAREMFAPGIAALAGSAGAS